MAERDQHHLYQVQVLLMLAEVAVVHMVVQELEPVVQAAEALVEIVLVVLPHQMEQPILAVAAVVAGSLIMPAGLVVLVL